MAAALGSPLQAQARRLNVLLVAVDDLNNRLGCYGDPVAKTPNIDRLARQGVRFDRAYCNYPLCNPSRTSLLSGLRPEKTQVFDNNTPPRTHLGNAVFLPEYFRRNGYFTARVGKIAHGKYEDAVAWDVSEAAQGQVAAARRERRRAGDAGNLIWRPGGEDEDHPDGRTARRIVQLIEQNKDKPFFIGCGFHKPHLPWLAPKKYFDLYSLKDIQLPREPADDLQDIPEIALTHRAPERKMTEQQRKEAMLAYHAATSFMDAQLGLVLDALDRHRLWDNTIVLLFGDHGWHLGEHHGLYRKMTVFEEAARAPLIVAAPERKRGVGCPRLVEFVDIYPSLAELAGLPQPGGLDGVSFAPLLDDPQRKWKKAAYTVVLHRRTLGRSLRTERYRYTEWGSPEVAELYDHEHDPKEYRNLARDAKFAAVIRELQALLKNPELAKPGP